jgi:ribosomal protein S18 acetylase RimI-like enzyme
MITIRAANVKDANAVTTLIGSLAETINETSPLTPAYAASYLARQGSQVLLAEEDGEVVGLLCYSTRPDLYHAQDCCMVEELVVSEGKRGQGIGSALLSTLLQQAKENGWAEVSVTVMHDNHQALQFYKQHGLVDEAVLLEKHID